MRPVGPPAGRVVVSVERASLRGSIVVITLNDGTALQLSADLVREEGLEEGALLPAERQDGLLAEDERRRAMARAVRLLAARDRSRGELERRLERLGFSTASVGQVVERAIELGYLDDHRFVGLFVAEKTREGWGSARIRVELRTRGIAAGLIDEALGREQDVGVGLPGGAFMAKVRRRFEIEAARDPERARQRTAGYLARRGYDWDTVCRILQELQQP